VRKIKTALISVYNKDGLLPILEELRRLEVNVVSTGGTYNYINSKGFECVKVEDITGYPSILGGRVKTLHPKVFGGILNRSDLEEDQLQLEEYEIPNIDLVIVDLYPFSETVNSGAKEQEVIEKIDIGGISLIRAAAKNFNDVLVIPSKDQYSYLLDILNNKNGTTDLSERKLMASQAFFISSHYDNEIFNYVSNDRSEALKLSYGDPNKLRYGENPHQQGFFYGDLEKAFVQLHGKQISYNNLLDIDSAIKVINDFEENTFAVIKHLNTCGLATRDNLLDAWKDALAGDPTSAFGGILVTKNTIHKSEAEEINKLFFEVIIASGYSVRALDILKSKKNRIILQLNDENLPLEDTKTVLFGTLVQDRDVKNETKEDLDFVTEKKPAEAEIEDMLFANKIVKHLKSNAIVLVKNKQLIGAGMGQPSRIDAMNQSIEKAKKFGFDLKGAVLASDAFFPFADSVELAHKNGITAVIQPGGSVRDKDSISYCNSNNLSMVFTGFRHFKH
jgi:phosphoribosylaminoimidazolecarboxamide formyltransferase/IMP cyclohydrolase